MRVRRTGGRGAGRIVWRDLAVAPVIRASGADMPTWLREALDQGTEDRCLPILLLGCDCREAIAAHLASAPVELGGLLVGTAWSQTPDDPDAPRLLRVEEAVPALAAESTGMSLRMDTELWERVRAAAEHRGGIIIGWYHSHPGLGAFFSRTDRRTQAAVFRHPYSLGLVVDPVHGEERWFLGPRCREIGPAREFSGLPTSEDREQDGGKTP
jgi:proteasome lid subunit RPN8/RPN11